MTEFVTDCPTSAPFSAVVVGLGQIGMGYDRHLPDDTHVLSHVRALRRHPQFHLLAAVDSNPILQQQFSAETGLPAYGDVAAFDCKIRPDAVVVASPTVTHPDVLAAVLAQMRPRVILCEKPLSHSLVDSESMIQDCRLAGVLLFVNFIRRSDPGVREVRARIRDGRIAGPLKAVVWYTKGMLHNASHLVDLMTYWMGPILAGSVIARGRQFGHKDAEADFFLKCDLGASIFCAAREESFSHYTVEILAANGRLRYERGGEIYWQGVEIDDNLNGFRRLSPTLQTVANDMDRYQLNVMTELALALQGESHGLCSGAEALLSQSWLERLYKERDLTKD